MGTCFWHRQTCCVLFPNKKNVTSYWTIGLSPSRYLFSRENTGKSHCFSFLSILSLSLYTGFLWMVGKMPPAKQSVYWIITKAILTFSFYSVQVQVQVQVSCHGMGLGQFWSSVSSFQKTVNLGTLWDFCPIHSWAKCSSWHELGTVGKDSLDLTSVAVIQTCLDFLDAVRQITDPTVNTCQQPIQTSKWDIGNYI